MVTPKIHPTEKLECHELENGVRIESNSLANSQGMIKSLFFLILVWFGTFLFILAVILKVDELRNYVINDLVSIKDVENFEKKAQRLFSYERKHASNLGHIDLDENTTIERQLNKTLANLLLKSKFDVQKEFQKFVQENRCNPVNDIVFLKTHKTASSTVTNILNRYADLRELSVVLPAMNDVRFAWPRKFHWSNVDLLSLDGQPGNMLVNHARYNREQMDMVMKENSKYISILRNPITQFESSFYYFEFDRILRLKNKPNPIEEFLKFPDDYVYNIALILGELPENINLIQSGMFYDFGYDFLDLESDDVIKEVLSKLEKDFQLIMIMEYFDESLVLLKKEMCWNFDDILYIKQNQRLQKSNLTDETKERIKNWSRADVMLYEHFNKTLWKKINKHGAEFWKDLNEFKKRNQEFENICSPRKIETKGFHINIDVSSFVMNPKVDRFNRYLCWKVLMSEVDYLKYMRKKLSMNYGYQKILIAEGIRPLKRTGELHKRLKRLKLMKRPKFFTSKNNKKKSDNHTVALAGLEKKPLVKPPVETPRRIFIPYT